jgi:hypothetical protein
MKSKRRLLFGIIFIGLFVLVSVISCLTISIAVHESDMYFLTGEDGYTGVYRAIPDLAVEKMEFTNSRDRVPPSLLNKFVNRTECYPYYHPSYSDS